MAKQLANQQKWRPWKGIILFLIVLAFLILGSPILSYYLGATGVLLSQLVMLGMAVAACLINKTKLKEVFPIRKITVRDFFGAVLMWAGGVMIGLTSAYLMGFLFPQTMAQVAGGINSLTATGFIVAFIATVICPPICEEAITRGALLSHFRDKKDWIIVLVVAIMFGIMHTDIVRFFNTAILGGVCAYLVVKRNNIILATIVHFINNFLFIGLSYILQLVQSGSSAGQAQVSQEELQAALEAASPALELGGFLTRFCIAPILFVVGVHLIKRQKEISDGVEPKGMKLWKKVLFAVPFTVLMLIGGIILKASV